MATSTGNKKPYVPDPKDRLHAKLFGLWAVVAKMVLDGVRDAAEVANTLQAIKEREDFHGRLFPMRKVEFKQIGAAEAHERAKLLTGWIDFYQKWFEVQDGFADLEIPPRPTDGPHFLVVVRKGYSLEQILTVLNSIFKDVETPGSVPIGVLRGYPVESYAIWIEGSIKKDYENPHG